MKHWIHVILCYLTLKQMINRKEQKEERNTADQSFTLKQLHSLISKLHPSVSGWGNKHHLLSKCVQLVPCEGFPEQLEPLCVGAHTHTHKYWHIQANHLQFILSSQGMRSSLCGSWMCLCNMYRLSCILAVCVCVCVHHMCLCVCGYVSTMDRVSGV